MKLRLLLSLLFCAVLLTACPPAEEATEAPAEPAAETAAEPAPEMAAVSATAVLTPRADHEGLSGTVTFTEGADGVAIAAHIEGAPAGDHGFHIHEVGDCSADDFTSSGGHFNPAGVDHAGPEAESHHAGDLGNVTVGEDGMAHHELSSSLITLGEGENSIVGRAVVLHENADDLTSQPTGAAGGRIACGVIALDGDAAMSSDEGGEEMGDEMTEEMTEETADDESSHGS